MVNDDGQLNILRTTPTELVFKTPKKNSVKGLCCSDLSFEK